MAIDIQKALDNDKNTQQGYDTYQKLEEKANKVAEEISTSLVDAIMKEDNDFNISTSIMALAKTLSMMASFLYDTEEDFLTDIQKARTCVVSDVIPALLDPQPCGLCDNCKNGIPSECFNPEVRGDYTLSKFLPILANMLIEYDLFNKVMFMHTIGRNEMDFDEALSTKEGEQNNGTISE